MKPYHLLLLILVLITINCANPIPEAPKAVLVIHGGAGWIFRENVSDSMENAYVKTLEAALVKGRAIVKEGGSSLDAIQQAIEHLEDSPLFNAGKGSVFTYNETNEMDSSIMDGKTGGAGAASGIRTIKRSLNLKTLVSIQAYLKYYKKVQRH